MSSGHSIVVWEYECEGEWLPHTPGVTRTLERAHAKKLTRVVLADADPALKGHYVNLRTLTQCRDTPEGDVSECVVRRACYAASGAGGRGARWEWARLAAPPHHADLLYHPMPMELQCLLESAWVSGGEGVSWRGWALSAARGTARRGPELRLLRRASQPPYPRDPPAAQHAPPPPARPPRLLHQHTGSSTHSSLSVRSAPPAHAAPPAPAAPRAGARSASPRDRKPGLARQILHNLNIFGHNNKQSPPPHGERERERERERSRESSTEEQRTTETDTECGSTRSGRRHSVDTVSTYLSHESKDSLQRGSVNSVLNCSGGSDDVFDSPAPDHHHELALHNREVCEGAEQLPGWVAARVSRVSRAQWGALCGACLQPLAGAALALRCHHMEHPACLRRRAAAAQEAGSLECLVCGEGVLCGARGEPPGPPPSPAPAPGPPPSQPPGSMAWRLQHVALPQVDSHTSILVTYNFQSGVQGPEQPVPGAPYYAVGFPRHSLLPDTPLGRQVLSALRVAWERRLLFRVCASQTTGREHVVAWRAAPPPAERAHYAPPAHPHRLLTAALDALHRLLHHHHHHQPQHT